MSRIQILSVAMQICKCSELQNRPKNSHSLEVGCNFDYVKLILSSRYTSTIISTMKDKMQRVNLSVVSEFVLICLSDALEVCFLLCAVFDDLFGCYGRHHRIFCCH